MNLLFLSHCGDKGFVFREIAGRCFWTLRPLMHIWDNCTDCCSFVLRCKGGPGRREAPREYCVVSRVYNVASSCYCCL